MWVKATSTNRSWGFRDEVLQYLHQSYNRMNKFSKHSSTELSNKCLTNTLVI